MRTRVYYARISTAAQKHDSQILALKQFMTTKGDDDRIVTDTGTGKNMTRRGMKSIVRGIEDGIIKEVVAWKQSRLGRSVLEILKFYDLCQKNDVKVTLLSDGIDFNSKYGKLLATMIAALDEMTLEIIRDNTLLGLEAAKANGKIVGGDRITGIRWLKNETYRQVDAIREDFQIGRSIHQIARDRHLDWRAVKHIVETPRHLLWNKKQAEQKGRTVLEMWDNGKPIGEISRVTLLERNVVEGLIVRFRPVNGHQ